MNFSAGPGRNLYTVWDGKQIAAGWLSLAQVPANLLPEARCCRRLAVTRPQYQALVAKLSPAGYGHEA